MNVTGIGPYIKRGAMKVYVSGADFTVGDAVRLDVYSVSADATTVRTGRVVELVDGGCIAAIGPHVDSKFDLIDDDLVEVTVTVTNSDGESSSSSEPGISE